MSNILPDMFYITAFAFIVPIICQNQLKHTDIDFFQLTKLQICNNLKVT